MGRRYLMVTSFKYCKPRTVDIYVNDRIYSTFYNCCIPTDDLMRSSLDYIIGDGRIGKIMIVERDDYNNPKPSKSE